MVETLETERLWEVGLTAPSRLKNGAVNSLMPSDGPIHNWYTFVLSFPAHLVRQYLERFSVDRESCTLDPFCGTGTTPVECKKHALPSIGVESNPMAYFASQTKVLWDIDAEAFLQDCDRIARIAAEKAERAGLGEYDDLPLFGGEPQPAALKDLSHDQWAVLSRAFISAKPLHRTLALLETIRSGARKPWTNHQELAVAKSLVSGIGNVAFGPEIGATEPKADAPVVRLWLRECQRIGNDLKHISPVCKRTPALVLQSDSRLPLPVSAKGVDFVITSPPYPNEKDYTRTTRLESVVLGFIQSRRDLRALKDGLLRSNTRNVFVSDEDDKWIKQFASVSLLAKQIEERRLALGKTSGFERLYARVVLLYFGGMRRHFENLLPALRPGAKLAYVVGDQMSYFRIPIRTGQILAEIAESLGYRVDGIDLWRTRLATVTKEWLREEVVLLSAPTH